MYFIDFFLLCGQQGLNLIVGTFGMDFFFMHSSLMQRGAIPYSNFAIKHHHKMSASVLHLLLEIFVWWVWGSLNGTMHVMSAAGLLLVMTVLNVCCLVLLLHVYLIYQLFRTSPIYCDGWSYDWSSMLWCTGLF
jgi:hypothetical protein